MRHPIVFVFFFVALYASNIAVEVTLVQTVKSTLDRLTEKPSLQFTSNTSTTMNILTVDPSKSFQTIIGFGGAFTEAASLNFQGLNPTLQQEVLDLYWGANGIGYSMGRVHMNSCDFCVYSYNFDNVTGDTSLSQFDSSVSHDQRTMIPFIKRANATATAAGHPIKLFLTPWSPPAWMKIPVDGKQAMDGSATPNGLMQENMQSWALYFSKFITAYNNSGVDIWGLTVQNEPEYAAPWEACTYAASYESFFVANFLGPQMKKDFPELIMMGYDHNRDDVYDYASVLYANQTTKNYLDGIAFHWYLGNELYNVNKTYWLDPTKFVLATEGCNCPGVELGNWERAENYGRDIIADLNFYSIGWVDWNLILSPKGGPNHVQNYCDAMIIADTIAQNIYIQPSFYYMGQISKYVPRGSKRIASSASVYFETPLGQQPYAENSFNVIVSECNGAPNQLWTSSWGSNSNIQLSNSNSLCLDIENWDSSNGANAQIYQCGDAQSNQEWSYVQHTGEIVSSLNGKCLDVLDFSVESGANVQMWDCTGLINQKWKLESDGTIRSESSNLCLTSGWSAFQHVAFVTPKGDTVLVVMNSSDNSLSFSIEDMKIQQSVATSIPAHSIQTYRWDHLK